MTKKPLPTTDELIVYHTPLEERNKSEEQRKLEESDKIKEQAKLEKRKKWLSLLQWVVIAFLIFIIGSFLYLVGQYVNPKIITNVSGVPASLSLAYEAPKYLAVGDENTVDITLTNLDPKVPFNGMVTLIISDNSVTSTLNRRMSIPIKDLFPNDRLTSQYKLKLSKSPSTKSINFHFQITTLPDNTQYVTSNGEFFISPIQRIRSFWAWITGGSGLIGLVVTFLFERFKNLLGVQK
jgi:hypothetical protein